MSSISWGPRQDNDGVGWKFESLIEKINLKFGVTLTNYDELHNWSISNLDDFWSLAWHECSIIGNMTGASYRPHENFWNAEFFPNATLNVAENLIMVGDDSDDALIAINESGQKVVISRKELRSQVSDVAKALTADGVSEGDKVVAWAVNGIEVAVYTLAALSIGAVVSTVSPEFGPMAVIDRFEQVQPKVLLASTSYTYNGRFFNCFEQLGEIVGNLPTLNRIVVTKCKISSTKFTSWESWLTPFRGSELVFKKFPFDHPGFILFSSGTTGKPKCIVHKAAGILLKLKTEQVFNLEIKSSSRVFYYTTCGWMMWNWLIFALACGSTVLLYDGSPTYKKLDKLFELAEDFQITHLGVSAKYVDILRKANVALKENYALKKLRVLMSTGSVLHPECFDYLVSALPSHVVGHSISGGTDLCGCFLNAIPSKSVLRGEIQGPTLGFNMTVLKENGQQADVFEKGELVCTTPFPSIPLGFLADANNAKFIDTYFSKHTNIWSHGDFATKTPSGGFIIFGRSDATLNVNGVRIGTAEIYRVLESFSEFEEALAVSHDLKSRIVLFVKMTSGFPLTDSLIQAVKDRLRLQGSPRHVPGLILEAPELPRTKSGKLVELAVLDIVNGRAPRNTDSLSNPEALKWFIESEHFWRNQ